MKTPKNINEKRQASALIHDDDCLIAGIRIRAKRMPSNLANDRDDKSIDVQRCWKEQRLTAYHLT